MSLEPASEVSELIELTRTLATQFSDVQIARILSAKRLLTAKGLPFTAARVAGLRRNYGIPPGPTVPQKGKDIYSALEAAKLLDVDRSTAPGDESAIDDGDEVWTNLLSEHF